MLKSVSNLKVRGLGFQNTPDCCGKCLAITIQNKNMKRNNAKENSVYNYNPPLKETSKRQEGKMLIQLTKFKLCHEQAWNIATVFINYNDIYAFYQGCALAVPGNPWRLTLAPRCLKNLLSFFLETICWAPQISQVQATGQGFFQFFLEHSLDFMDYSKSIWDTRLDYHHHFDAIRQSPVSERLISADPGL